ncbi:MAG: succinate dehydrogenase cytochrome b subunit [Leptolyngbyaceae cyanobacterium]
MPLIMEKTVTQPSILRFYRSPIGKKLVTGMTGLGLVTFVSIHLTGNLLLFAGHDAYNAFAHFLESLGPLFWLTESMLLAVFALHIAAGLQLFVHNRRSRPDRYARYASRGKPSLQSLSSRTMPFTGMIIGAFLVIHLLNFKFGTYYLTQLDGQTVRDLSRLVIEKFQTPWYTFGYTGVMVLLGVHLRHGFWSALQSLGLMSKGLRFSIYGLSLVLAIAISAGFIGLPLAIYAGLLH